MHRVEANGSGYTCMYGAVPLRTGTDDVDYCYYCSVIIRLIAP